MNTVGIRRQTSFRLSDDLIARLRDEAKKRNRSLNNFVESILMGVVYNTPNETTLAAMKEAKDPDNLESLDIDSLREYIAAL